MDQEKMKEEIKKIVQDNIDYLDAVIQPMRKQRDEALFKEDRVFHPDIKRQYAKDGLWRLVSTVSTSTSYPADLVLEVMQDSDKGAGYMIEELLKW